MTNLFDVALKQLSSHNCSERELRQLLEKEFASLVDMDEKITATFERLRELHLMNDARVAESLANRHAHKGNRFIVRLLQQKGISQTVIEEALATLANEKERALEEARKKLRNLSREGPRAVEVKLGVRQSLE